MCLTFVPVYLTLNLNRELYRLPIPSLVLYFADLLLSTLTLMLLLFHLHYGLYLSLVPSKPIVYRLPVFYL
jgi:hypothetical protein